MVLRFMSKGCDFSINKSLMRPLVVLLWQFRKPACEGVYYRCIAQERCGDSESPLQCVCAWRGDGDNECFMVSTTEVLGEALGEGGEHVLGHEATDTRLAYAPVSRAHGHHDTQFNVLPCCTAAQTRSVPSVVSHVPL